MNLYSMRWDASRFDLSNLRPRSSLLRIEEFRYAIQSVRQLKAPASPSLRTDLHLRRTARHFGAAPLEEVAALLWHVSKPAQTVEDSFGRVSLRMAPSAGARHPIDFLLVPHRDGPVYVYLPESNSLGTLAVDLKRVHSLWRQAEEMVDVGEGALLWMVAQPGRTLSKYENGEPFVLMDAGALAATISFAATALGLSYCPLGRSGEPVVSKLLRSSGLAIGILGGVVGAPRL